MSWTEQKPCLLYFYLKTWRSDTTAVVKLATTNSSGGGIFFFSSERTGSGTTTPRSAFIFLGSLISFNFPVTVFFFFFFLRFCPLILSWSVWV